MCAESMSSTSIQKGKMCFVHLNLGVIFVCPHLRPLGSNDCMYVYYFMNDILSLLNDWLIVVFRLPLKVLVIFYGIVYLLWIDWDWYQFKSYIIVFNCLRILFSFVFCFLLINIVIIFYSMNSHLKPNKNQTKNKQINTKSTTNRYLNKPQPHPIHHYTTFVNKHTIVCPLCISLRYASVQRLYRFSVVFPVAYKLQYVASPCLQFRINLTGTNCVELFCLCSNLEPDMSLISYPLLLTRRGCFLFSV